MKNLLIVSLLLLSQNAYSQWTSLCWLPTYQVQSSNQFVTFLDAFISLVPKTTLSSYYINEYGMEEAGKSVYSDTLNSAELMDKYS